MGDALQDGAAQGSPADVGAILGVLRSVGLVGPKLALQLGEEPVLAKQLAERAGIPYEGWVLDLVRAQVKGAYDDLDLDIRLAGSAKTPGQQAVDDAVHCMTKPQASAASSEVVPQKRTSVEVPQRGKMLRIPKGKPLQGKAGEPEDEAILRVLFEELEMMGAPVVAQVLATANPDRAKAALLGKYRASTVKRYLAYWQGFRRWVGKGYGKLPCQGEQLVDYLLAREEEGMGPSVPLSVGKGVAWFEKLAGFDQEQMISAAPLVDTVTRDLLKKLEEKAPPRKRAPRMLSAFLPALERLVVNKDLEPSIRAGAWVKLLKVWASLRFDDVAHMKPEMLRVYDKKLSGLMKRTKTPGGGKRVKGRHCGRGP